MSLAVRHERVGSLAAPRRLRIAHLSDLHVWFGDAKLRQIEAALEEWSPDVLAFTGDYADTPAGQDIAAAWMERLAQTHPVCWVAGNHDHWWGGAMIRKLHTVRGAFAIDERDAWVESREGGRFCFTSWARATLGATRPETTPTVVLLHDPEEIDGDAAALPANTVLLAGHLHGGQFTLWHDRAGRPQPAGFCYPRLGDRSSVGAAPLIVSRGLGDTLPLRFRTPREIVIVDFFA